MNTSSFIQNLIERFKIEPKSETAQVFMVLLNGLWLTIQIKSREVL